MRSWHRSMSMPWTPALTCGSRRAKGPDRGSPAFFPAASGPLTAPSPGGRPAADRLQVVRHRLLRGDHVRGQPGDTQGLVAVDPLGGQAGTVDVEEDLPGLV